MYENQTDGKSVLSVEFIFNILSTALCEKPCALFTLTIEGELLKISFINTASPSV